MQTRVGSTHCYKCGEQEKRIIQQLLAQCEQKYCSIFMEQWSYQRKWNLHVSVSFSCLWVVLQVQVLSVSLLEACKCITHCPVPQIIILIMPFGENYKHSLRGCNSILQEVKSLVVTKNFFVSFLCIHCSCGRYLFARRISAIYCIFPLGNLEWLGSSHIWSSASRNEILCSLNQFNQNFLFATNILKFLNLSERDGNRSFSPIWNFHSILTIQNISYFKFLHWHDIIRCT